MPDVLREAQERLQTVLNAEGENRQAAEADLKFAAGDQWPVDVRNERELEARPCLTINKLPAFINQITNNQRQSRPQIKVHPVDGGADVEKAKVITGLIRHIENNSSAESAYDTAFDFAVRMGWGYWRIVTDYVDDNSFEQDIFIRRIRNPFSVYFDPNSSEPDGSDADYCLISDWIGRDKFKERFPDAQSNDLGLVGQGDAAPQWLAGDAVRIAEYFRYERQRDNLLLLEDGTVTYESDVRAAVERGVMVPGIKQSRPTHKRVVLWSKLTFADELETKVWPGKFIPVVPCYGVENFIDGKRELHGIVRFAKDPQRMFNYWRTAETENLALAPRAPWLVAEGQIEGYEQMWDYANVKSFPYLPFKQTDSTGQPAPRPERIAPPIQPTGLIQAALEASDDIKSATGIFDASLGARGNETSGRAIVARQRQGDTANFHFFDNLTRSLRHTGRILLDLIPKIYDTRRVIRVLGEDQQPQVVVLNDPQVGPSGAIEDVLNDVTIGTYDVVMDTGSSYQTRRQETVDFFTQLAQSNPQIWQIAGDIIVKNMDIPGAQEIAERLQKLLPPPLQQGPKDIPPEVQGMMQQAQQQMQQMQQYISQCEQQLQAANAQLQDQSADRELKAQIAQMQEETKRVVAYQSNETKKDVEELKGLIAMLLAKQTPPSALADELVEREQQEAGF